MSWNTKMHLECLTVQVTKAKIIIGLEQTFMVDTKRKLINSLPQSTFRPFPCSSIYITVDYSWDNLLLQFSFLSFDLTKWNEVHLLIPDLPQLLLNPTADFSSPIPNRKYAYQYKVDSLFDYILVFASLTQDHPQVQGLIHNGSRPI